MANNFFGYTISPARIVIEPHALDSYQNILFSLLTFYAHSSRFRQQRYYPSSMTIVSHAFKRARFLDLHLPALRWSSPSSSSSPFSLESSLDISTTVNTNNDDGDGEQKSRQSKQTETKVDHEQYRVRFIGIDPPPAITSSESLHEGECRRGYGLWKTDPYGGGPALSAKRAGRDPWGTTARFLDLLVEPKYLFGRNGPNGDDGDEVRAKGVQEQEQEQEEGAEEPEGLRLGFEVNNLLVWKGPVLVHWELPWMETRDQRFP